MTYTYNSGWTVRDFLNAGAGVYAYTDNPNDLITYANIPNEAYGGMTPAQYLTNTLGIQDPLNHLDSPVPDTRDSSGDAGELFDNLVMAAVGAGVGGGIASWAGGLGAGAGAGDAAWGVNAAGSVGAADTIPELGLIANPETAASAIAGGIPESMLAGGPGALTLGSGGPFYDAFGTQYATAEEAAAAEAKMIGESTVANSAAGSGLTPEGFPTSGYPSVPGAPSGSSGGTANSAGSALQRILDGTRTTADWLSVLGSAVPGLIGAYGASQQADALQNIANQANQRWQDTLAMGAPYRTRLSDLYANPSSFLTSPEVTVPVQQGTNALANALSIHGNPAGSGHALQELQDYSANQLFGRLGQEKDRLSGFGGLTAYNNAGAQGPDLTAAIGVLGANSNIYNMLGRSFGGVFGQDNSLLRSLGYSRSTTGVV